MGNHACIAIGINHYQFFQPLNYAQADAQSLWEFLLQEAGWKPENCLLLTDSSSPLDNRPTSLEANRSTYPTKTNILAFVGDFIQSLHPAPQDLLWFFFSGYGVSLHGEDYLMPIDGNPSAIAETGILVRELFEQLQSKGAKSILVLLDINRSQSLQNDNPVGLQIVELGQKLKIPMVFSCQLDQFSHEASALGHGLFTVGLLEALRYDPDITLSSLDWYLRARLPELSEHHWQPIQIPLTVTNSGEANDLLILHPEVNHKIPVDMPFVSTNSSQSSMLNGQTAFFTPSIAESVPEKVLISKEQERINIDDHAQKTPQLTFIETESKSKQIAPIFKIEEEAAVEEEIQNPWWQKLLFWSGGVAVVLLLILGVFMRNRDAFMGKISPNTRNSKDPNTSQKRTPILSSNNPSSANPKSTNKNNNNQQPLKTSISSQESVQVLQFKKAITQAQKVKQDDPGYEQAQQEISRWSREILNIAEESAKQGNLSAAVASAQLIPPGNAVYTEAQQVLVQWKEVTKKQWENQLLLQAAKGLIRPGQASSYNHAIIVAYKIPPDQQGLTDAKRLITEWSQTIYNIAQSRAVKGKFAEAIQTANLIPKNTPLYDDAQKAIVTWKAEKK